MVKAAPPRNPLQIGAAVDRPRKAAFPPLFQACENDTSFRSAFLSQFICQPWIERSLPIPAATDLDVALIACLA
jgi:hypothetical protein